jgi:hypothetical protein
MSPLALTQKEYLPQNKWTTLDLYHIKMCCISQIFQKIISLLLEQRKAVLASLASTKTCESTEPVVVRSQISWKEVVEGMHREH